MPIGDYPDWDACIQAQLAKGYDMQTAERICGWLEKQSRAEGDRKDESIIDSNDCQLSVRARNNV